MALDTNFNVNPYNDDFDEDKKYLRMLFKPGYAIQARELTQLQTLLQKQVNRFGDHVFKNGSVVTGGQTTLQDATYINVASTYSSTDVVANNFIGQTIFSTDDSKRAEVLKVYEANGTEPITLMVKQVFGDAFVDGETIKTNETSPYLANVADTDAVGTGKIFSVIDGVYYYDGYFIKTDAQTVAVNKYTNTAGADAKIGFEVTESIVKSTQDTSLLDPAQDASNYQAPGSDRYKIELILAKRAIDSEDTAKFIELASFKDGDMEKRNDVAMYAVLEESLARRTYDESGNYTVRPFTIALSDNSSNTANLDITVSPGKAYVYGYEFERTAPTVITVEKPRDIANVTNKRLTADYGYYVYTNGHYGSMPINNLATIDLHCVANASLNISSSAALTNTKIGTARVKSISFDSSSNTSNSATYEYRTFLMDVNVGSITGTIKSANTGNVTIGNVTAGQVFSTVNDAYKGAKLRIVTGPGSTEAPKTITGWTGSTQLMTLSSNFVTVPTSASTFAIDFEFNDVKSLASFSGTTRLMTADVDDRSRDFASTYDDTFITDATYEPLLFKLGSEYVNNNLSDFSYSYKKLFSGLTFGVSDSPVLTVETNATLATATSTTAKSFNYQIIVTSAGTSPYAVGSTIPADKITNVDVSTGIITVENANNMVANVVATVDYALSSGNAAKVKTLVTANATVQTSGGESVNSAGAIVYASQGQTTIAASNVIKTPGTKQTLYVSDVVELISVYDFNGGSVANTGYTDITSHYELDNGQKNSYYDHAGIKLKPGYAVPTGPLVVRYNAYSSSGSGFFSVDSYPDYNTIPSFTSPTTGETFKLRDCLDFRPVRKNATNALDGTTVTTTFDITTAQGPKIPESGSDISVDFSHYLARKDRLVLNKNKTFSIIKGDSAINPVIPPEKDDSMTLYVLDNPPYVTDSSQITLQYFNNRRYTMKDIGSIDKRVDNLEYYTSLSLLEQDALGKQDLTILDSTNTPRFKNGILVDSFVGHSVGDVTNRDYTASIDTKQQELRPSFNVSSRMLAYDSAGSTGVEQHGPIIMVAGAPTGGNTTFINQPLASKLLNVNPFNVVNYIGKIKLDPPSDVWVDTTTNPDVNQNIGGDMDAWTQIAAAGSAYGYEWNPWQTYWEGTTQTEVSPRWRSSQTTVSATVVQTTTTKQTRTGTQGIVTPQSVTVNLGKRIVDMSIVPYMRNKNVLVSGSDFRPDATLYSFFDGISVEKYVSRANRVILATNNLQYKTTVGSPETVRIVDNNAGGTTNATALVVKTSNNNVFLVSVTPTTNLAISGATLVGQTTGVSHVITGYEHNSGKVQAATSNTVTLRIDANGAINEGYYANTSNSSTIFITSGTGAGQEATMASYNASTRVVTISGTWATTPDTTSVYSIGRLRTTAAGDIAGVFSIPAGTFRVGEKLFRLIDTSSGDIPSSLTNGDATFFAQGTTQTNETTTLTTIRPTVQRVSVTDERILEKTTVTQAVVQYVDPLAQTFLVSPQNFSQGVYIEKVRFCFASKDDVVPVTLQVRPTNNGYPSSTTIYPFGTVSLTPDKVKVSDSPDLDDPEKYTDFVFDVPLYVQPGEHSFALVANSNKYLMYVGQIGQLDIATGKQISEQPYGGSLFLSQNGSTWTADQNSDMMFRVYRKVFDVEAATVQFKIDAPSTNTVFDLANLISSEVRMANTDLVYSFSSEKTTGGMTDFKPLNELTNYEMNDGSGQRVLSSTTGNNTFVLRASMNTLNSDISPVVDTSRFGVIFVDNTINNLPLVNSGFVVSNTGSGYANSADVTVTVSPPTGSGAQALAVANVTANVITGITLTYEGSGYTTSPTISISAGSGGGSGAVVTYNGEDTKSGGNAKARYITRKVTLADGFDSGDLRVYLTGYKPSGSNIYVYAKMLSKSDPDNFDDKNWQLLTELGNSGFVSLNANDYRELTFAPGINGAANNSITYTSGSTAYTTFRTFAIKIVMTGSDSTNVPKVRDLRVIALPSGS